MKSDEELEREIMNQVAHLRWAESQGVKIPISDIEDLPIVNNFAMPCGKDDYDSNLTGRGGIRNCCNYKHLYIDEKIIYTNFFDDINSEGISFC